VSRRPTSAIGPRAIGAGTPGLRSRFGAFGILVSLLLVLAGCSGEAQLTLPHTPTPPSKNPPLAATPRTTPVPSPSLGQVVWATAVDPTTGAPADSVTAYAPDDPQLIAAFPATALPAGAVVDAAWFYNDTSLDAFNTTLTVPDHVVKRWVDLRLARSADAPWPAGTYEVVVSLAGDEVRRASVLVVDRQS
jgi:hypothetical protein